MKADHNSHNLIDRCWVWVVFGLTASYLWMLQPNGLASFGWSTDFVRLGLVGGNFWATHLSLLLRFVGLIGKLPGMFSIQAGYALASLLGAATLAGVYQLLGILYRQLRLPNDWLGFYVKNMVIVGLLSSRVYTMQGIFLERYMLAAFLLVSICLLLLTHNGSHLRRLRLVLLGLAMVLGATYHWIFWWSAIGIGLWWFLGTNFRATSERLGIFVGGFLLLILGSLLFTLWLSNDSPPDHSFRGVQTVSDIFTWHRQAFLQDGFEGVLQINKKTIPLLWQYAQDIFKQPLGGFWLVMFGVGLIRTLWVKWAWGLGQLWISIGLFGLPLLLFSGIKDPLTAIELFELLWRVWLSIGAGVGLHFLLHRIKLGLLSLHSDGVVKFFYALGTGVVLTTLLYFGYYQTPLTLSEDAILRESLSRIPQRGILLCFEQVTCADLLYLQQVSDSRTDLTVVPYYYHPDFYLQDLQTYRPFGYTTYPYFMHEILAIALHTPETRVFSFGMTDDYYRFLGFDLGFVHYLPQGDFGELVLTTPDQWPQPRNLELDVTKIPDRGGLESAFVNMLLRNHILNTFTYFKSGYYDWGYEEMNAAAITAHKLSSSEFAQFLTDRNAAEQQVKSSLFTQSARTDSIEIILNEIPKFVEAGYPGRALDLARGLLILSPYEPLYRETAAQLYESVGLTALAQFEQHAAEKLRTGKLPVR